MFGPIETQVTDPCSAPKQVGFTCGSSALICVLQQNSILNPILEGLEVELEGKQCMQVIGN